MRVESLVAGETSWFLVGRKPFLVITHISPSVFSVSMVFVYLLWPDQFHFFVSTWLDTQHVTIVSIKDKLEGRMEDNWFTLCLKIWTM